jgi:hypothetical protein
MGLLASINNWSGYAYGATLLGDPIILEDGRYGWDDESLPSADVEADSVVLSPF